MKSGCSDAARAIQGWCADTRHGLTINPKIQSKTMKTPPISTLGKNASAWALMSALAVGMANAVLAQELPTSGLVARWDFDEGTGPVAHDTSGNNNHGTLDNYTDDSQWVAGRFGGGLAFNGQTSNRLIVPDSPKIGADLVNAFTVSAWFRSNVELPAGGSGAALLEKGNSYFLLQGVASGGMNFLMKKATVNFTVPLGESLAANVWYNVVGVFDGAQARLYLNGELKGNLPVAAPIDSTDLPLVIGGDDASRTFNGVIDRVAIWNRALTDEEVLQVAGRVGAPKIEQQPEPMSVYEGGTARFTVNATGADPLRYLWYKGAEPLRTQTARTLLVEYATPADAGEYSVEVSNEIGTTRSVKVNLEVKPVTGLQTARVLYLPFDETAGLVAADASGNGNAGQLLGYWDETSHWGPGRVNNSLGFDCDDLTSNYGNAVAVPDSPSLDGVTGEVTFAFWIKPAAWGVIEDVGNYTRSASYILRKGNHFGIRLINDPGTVVQTIVTRAGPGADDGSVLRKAFEVNAPQGSASLDQWQHWAVVYRNGTITFYKDGFPVGEPAVGTLGSPDDAPLMVGGYDDAFSFVRTSLLDGRLDEVGIWVRPLSEVEILELAARDINGPPAIVQQPASQKRIEGTTVSFQVFATGKRPIQYQWLKNGVEIPSANSQTFVIDRAQLADAGAYSVRLTNSEGTTTSQPAVLEIEPLDAITSGLVAYYPFDDGPGTKLADASGNNLHGTLRNMDDSSRVAGKIGGAFRFDGIDDFVVVDHSPLLNLTSEATVSLWLYIDGLSDGSDWDRVFRKGTTYDFVLINNGILQLDGINKTAYRSPSGSWETGVWAHYAYTAKNGVIQWYKNGEPLGDPLPGQLGELNTDPLVIANYADGLAINRPYMGVMDDFGIWQRALGPSEILGIYVNGLQGKPLNEKFEPLNIKSIRTVETGVELAYYSPYTGRPTQVEAIQSLSDPTWTAQANAQIVDLGQGNYRATIPMSAPTAFFRVAVLPPPPLFFDDFETEKPEWTHGGEGDIWERGVPTTGPGSAYSPTRVYATGLSRNLEPYSDAWLRSPEIDLTGVSSAFLRFAEWLNLDFIPGVPAANQTHQAVVNILDAETLAPVQQNIYLGTGSSNGWQIRQVRLVGDAVGRKIKIEFRVITDPFNLQEGWFLDDVTVFSY